MLRKFAALAVLAVAGTALLFPNDSFASAGGIRGFHGGGFHSRGGFHGRALRAPFIGHRVARPGFLHGPRIGVRPPPSRVMTHFPVRTHVSKPFSHLARRHHHRFVNGWVYPITLGDSWGYDAGYIGVPYDPGEAIPVYAPSAAAADPVTDPPAPRYAPRLSSVPNDNQDACRSERVTVPAGDGEREITVVRC